MASSIFVSKNLLSYFIVRLFGPQITNARFQLSLDILFQVVFLQKDSALHLQTLPLLTLQNPLIKKDNTCVQIRSKVVDIDQIGIALETSPSLLERLQGLHKLLLVNNRGHFVIRVRSGRNRYEGYLSKQKGEDIISSVIIIQPALDGNSEIDLSNANVIESVTNRAIFSYIRSQHVLSYRFRKHNAHISSNMH